jgi:hypothetical protein
MTQRTLTVCEGRQTLGHIKEHADKQFFAQPLTGKALGPFSTTAEAAGALSADHKAKMAARVAGGRF